MNEAFTKYFNQGGVSYTVNGDSELADLYLHSAKAQMHQLEMNNVFQLAQVASDKVFDDGTVIGCSIVNGVKQTIISGPIEEEAISGEDKKRKVEREHISEQIVPLIMVTDIDDEGPSYRPDPVEGIVLGFIACMSGTFEGPYEFFPNTHEYSHNEFWTEFSSWQLEDTLADGTVLADKIDKSLCYIKPTGEFNFAQETEEEGSIPTVEYGPTYVHTTFCLSLDCGSLLDCGPLIMFSQHRMKTGSVDGTLTSHYEVQGERLDIPGFWYMQQEEIDMEYRAGTWTNEAYVCGMHDCNSYGSGTLHIKELVEDMIWESWPSASFQGSHDGASFVRYVEFPNWAHVSAEAANVENFACFYSTEYFDESSSTVVTNRFPSETCPALCSSDKIITGGYDAVNTNTAWFGVDGTQHKIPGMLESPNEWGFIQQFGLNYYGSDNIATGIMAGQFWLPEPGVRVYCYVGPNSGGKISITKFDSTSSDRAQHEIPGIIGMSSEIAEKALFHGEVLLGIVRHAATKETVWE